MTRRVDQQTCGDLKLGETPAFRTLGFHTATRFDPGLSSERPRRGAVRSLKANTRVINLLHAEPIDDAVWRRSLQTKLTTASNASAACLR